MENKNCCNTKGCCGKAEAKTGGTKTSDCGKNQTGVNKTETTGTKTAKKDGVSKPMGK